MTNLWKQFGVLATRSLDKVISNIFVSARLRITFLYFLVGLLMFSVAGIFIYVNTLNILQNFTEGLSGAISSTIPPVSPSITTESIDQEVLKDYDQKSLVITNTVEDQIRWMIYTISFWTILFMLVSAYVLSGITMRPIERAMENKRRFIANVSHELRTPLSITRTEAEATLMNEEATTKEELVAALKGNIEEVGHMAKILELLLTFSNFEHRAKSLVFSPVNLSDVVEKTTRIIGPAADKKGVRLELRNTNDMFIRGNGIAIQEVFLNLIKNAIQYTPSGGHVRVVLGKKLYGIVMVSVTDTGIGIAPEEIPHVFEPFYRGRKNRSSGKAHSGIGLAIAREIITLHRGTITIQSKVGKGTTVEVRFPLIFQRPQEKVS